MNSQDRAPRTYVLRGLAVAAGLAIAAVDNFAFGGEVSPIVIVILLLFATILLGVPGVRRPWLGTLAVWIWLPLAHAVKHLLGLPDTLHPNSYASIALLGVFTLGVAAVGTGLGVVVRRSVSGAPR